MNFDRDFIVHYYSTTSTQPSQSPLYTAYELIRDTLPESLNWINVTVDNAPPLINFGQTKNLVQYPPFFEKLHKKRPEDRDYQTDVPWGEQNDIFSLRDLEEFRTTDLSFLFNISPRELSLKLHPTPLSQQEEGSLHDIIPQPHVRPSSFSNLIGPSKLIPYRKTKPILIPPRAESFSPSPYSRSAWLIPIRGKPPWDQCTAALVLNSSYDALHIDFKNRGEIVWTPLSIRSFWDFLLEIKARRSAGGIGLSFHASASCNASSIPQSNNAASLMTPGKQENMVITDPTSHAEVTTVSPRALLSTVDYIKIYHEALNAMHLRNMLHLWSYTESQSSGKIRILKGAILALMDERSTGILLS